MTCVCSFPGCFNKPRAAMLWQRDPTGDAPLSFHGLPLHDPDTLRLWLVALGMDLDSSMDTIRTLRVCSQHFSKDDFCPPAGSRQSDGPVLKSTAVPAAARSDATECLDEFAPHHSPDPCYLAPIDSNEGSVNDSTSDEAQDSYFTVKIKEEEIESEETLNDPTQYDTQNLNPAVKIKDEDIQSEVESLSAAGVSDFTTPGPNILTTGQEGGEIKIPAKLLVVSRNPEQATQTTASTSATYLARPPTWEYQTDDVKKEVKTEQDAAEQDSTEQEATEQDAPTHVPPDTVKQEEGSGGSYDRKWPVNESNLFELFKTCHQCGAKVEGLSATAYGCYIKLDWCCRNGHNGQWSSSPDI
ncbi:uncharacterized protein LOC115364746 [Myripristis murdjan]|uniref:uncharacterized protein LOC115364746 n=1 Tax=Myripristis murdjan TaxID=586833 RepID=UPI0011761913|nr:uncharacterized protein LOC115364746 [Myripristis murdjan]